MIRVVDESERHVREAEAEVLAQIGQYLFEQDLNITVRLPARLASSARAAWERSDTSALEETEAHEARTVRHQAGALALIGLAVQERSATGLGDQVQVALDAWQVGNALDAADQRGLLAGLRPADRDT